MDGSMGEFMVGLYETLAIFGMFILRLGIPLVLTLGVGYLLRRLDRNWEAEATARRRALDAEILAAHLPQIPTIEQHCWEVHSCPPQAKDSCSARSCSTVACWIARYRAEGKLPAACAGCSVFLTARQEATKPAISRFI